MPSQTLDIGQATAGIGFIDAIVCLAKVVDRFLIVIGSIGSISALQFYMSQRQFDVALCLCVFVCTIEVLSGLISILCAVQVGLLPFHMPHRQGSRRLIQ